MYKSPFPCRNVEIFSAELHLPGETILTCAFIDKVLSLTWTLEDRDVGPDWESSLAIVRLLSRKVDI